MKKDRAVEMLRVVSGLKAAPERELRQLVRYVDQVDIARGTCLTREGELGHEAFIVVEGTADVFVDGHLIASVGPGSFIGEMAMLDSNTRSATVRAATDVRALVIGPAAFGAFAADSHVARAMSAQLSKRLRDTVVTAAR